MITDEMIALSEDCPLCDGCAKVSCECCTINPCEHKESMKTMQCRCLENEPGEEA